MTTVGVKGLNFYRIISYLLIYRSYASKVYYTVTVGGIDVSRLPNLITPRPALIARLLQSRGGGGLSVCQCRAKRTWRILVRGSQTSVLAPLIVIRDSIRQAWAARLRLLRKMFHRLFSVEYKPLIVLTTNQPDYLHNLISVQSTGRTCSSSVVTLARPSVCYENHNRAALC